MSVAEWAAVVGAAAAVALVGVIAWIAVAVRNTLKDVQETVVDLRKTINKIDPVLEDAQSLLATVETVLKTPGVKAAAIASGLGRGVQHLREKLH
jgi:signal transduction histidine kinase